MEGDKQLAARCSALAPRAVGLRGTGSTGSAGWGRGWLGKEGFGSLGWQEGWLRPAARQGVTHKALSPSHSHLSLL